MQGNCTFYQRVVIFVLIPNEVDMRESLNQGSVYIGERITTCKEINQTNRLQNGTLFEMYILQGGGEFSPSVLGAVEVRCLHLSVRLTKSSLLSTSECLSEMI